MARHNRVGRGADQRGFDYEVSYQPDWLHQVKVTRALETGRQSTKTLFRNVSPRERLPGGKVRTRVNSAEQGFGFEVVLDDPGRVVRRVVIETALPGGGAESSRVVVMLEEKAARREPAKG